MYELKAGAWCTIFSHSKICAADNIFLSSIIVSLSLNYNNYEKGMDAFWYDAGSCRQCLCTKTCSQGSYIQRKRAYEDSGNLEILKDADASTYNLSIEQNGKVTRLGSAGMRGLSKVSAYHKAGGKASAANEIVTTIDNYIQDGMDKSF